MHGVGQVCGVRPALSTLTPRRRGRTAWPVDLPAPTTQGVPNADPEQRRRAEGAHARVDDRRAAPVLRGGGGGRGREPAADRLPDAHEGSGPLLPVEHDGWRLHRHGLPRLADGLRPAPYGALQRRGDERGVLHPAGPLLRHRVPVPDGERGAPGDHPGQLPAAAPGRGRCDDRRGRDGKGGRIHRGHPGVRRPGALLAPRHHLGPTDRQGEGLQPHASEPRALCRGDVRGAGHRGDGARDAGRGLPGSGHPRVVHGRRLLGEPEPPVRAPGATLPRRGRHASRIHLHDVQARPALPAGPDRPRGHLDLVLPGRQDRRHRAERRRQVEPARIMAGLDDGFTGEARLTPGFTVGYLEPGAAARPGQGRQGQRARRRPRGPRPHRAVQRGHGEVVRPGRRLRGDRRRAVGARGPDQRGRRVEPRAERRHRDGRAALPARRRRRHDALGRREAPRGARRLLLQHPDLLLLDEPTNHLDAESVEWLERFLGEYSGTVVAITHDRYFLDNVAKWILELDRGRGIPFSGNYSSWLEQKLERMAASRSRSTPASARSPASSSGCAWARRRARRRARPA
jgi:hypothetical protein